MNKCTLKYIYIYIINAQNTNNQMKLTDFYQNLMDYLDKLCRSISNDSYS